MFYCQMLQTITHAEVQVKSKSKDSGSVWKHSSNKSRNVHVQVVKQLWSGQNHVGLQLQKLYKRRQNGDPCLH